MAGLEPERARERARSSPEAGLMGGNRIAALFSAPLARRRPQQPPPPPPRPPTPIPTKTKIFRDGDQLPQPMPHLNFQRERSLLLQSLREGCAEVGREIEVRVEPATSDSLRTVVTLGCRAIHFSGHGHADFLCFENGAGGVHAMESAALSQLFAAGETSNVQLVFVSACHSLRTGRSFAAAGVPHVVAVAMEGRLQDRAALVFTRAFYLALISGKTVRQSFDIGKAAVASAPGLRQSESQHFVLLPEDGDHNAHIFADAPAGLMRDITPPLPPHNLPAPPDHFQGREVQLFCLIRKVLQDRLVTVTGPFGMGKSALAVAAARFLREHRRIDAACYLRLTTSDAAWRDLAAALARTLGDPDLEMPGAPSPERCRDAVLRALQPRAALLILDNADQRAAHVVLRELLTGTSDCKVIITSDKSVGRITSITEHVHSIEPLSPRDAAQLLIDRVAMRGEVLPPVDELAQHAVMGSLAGNPFSLSLAATIVQSGVGLDDLHELLEGRVESEDQHVASLVQEIRFCIRTGHQYAPPALEEAEGPAGDAGMDDSPRSRRLSGSRGRLRSRLLRRRRSTGSPPPPPPAGVAVEAPVVHKTIVGAQHIPFLGALAPALALVWVVRLVADVVDVPPPLLALAARGGELVHFLADFFMLIALHGVARFVGRPGVA